jgi:hypothetical protein
MSKNYSKIKGRSSPRFIMLRYDLIDSEAWRSLPAAAQTLWLHIRRRYNGDNNGNIPLSCREGAELLGVSKNTANNMFEALINRGFIKVGQDSSFSLKLKKSRCWILTDEGYAGQAPTSDWRNWKKTRDAELNKIQNTVIRGDNTVSLEVPKAEAMPIKDFNSHTRKTVLGVSSNSR